jgi:YHS domain-containing protein
MLRFVLEFVVFLIAISVVKTVLRAVQGFFAAASSHPPQSARPQTASREGATVLQQDPVCGTYVAIDTSLKKVVGGKVLHFCSPECRDRWQG